VTAAWLGGFGLVFISVLTCWPVARLAEAAGVGSKAAASVAILWVLCPAASFFFGDSLLTFLVTSWAALVCAAFRRVHLIGQCLLGLASGAVAGTACFVSFAAPPMLVATGVGALGLTAIGAGAWRRTVRVATFAVIGFLIVCGIPMAFGYDAVGTVREALRIHHAQYTAPRSYTTWLRYNLLDFSLFLGWPIVAVAVTAVAGWLWSGRRCDHDRFQPFRLLAVMAVTVLALDLAGVTRGEVGRLWMPLMPMTMVGTLVAASGAVNRDGPSSAERDHNAQVVLLGVLLAIMTLAISMSWVSAFEIVVGNARP
jgi:hypothetical protein